MTKPNLAGSIPVSPLSAYLPIDRRFALAEGRKLPDRARGAALFADISGFTKLSVDLSQDLGPSHGAEVLTQQINFVYSAIIEQVHRYRGSVVGFSGDAITCWFNETDDSIEDLVEAAWRAVTCALDMQEAIKGDGGTFPDLAAADRPGIKIAVTAGPVRRFMVGRSSYRRIDTLAGVTLDRLASSERQAKQGEVVIDTWTLALIGDHLHVATERTLTGESWVAVVEGLKIAAEPYPWPAPPELPEDVAVKWILKPIYRRVVRNEEEYLSELRTAATVFGRFSGIEYDIDDEAEAKLDAYIRWLQSVIASYHGYLIQLTIGDKGSYFQASFGAPIAYGSELEDALQAALTIRKPPPEIAFIDSIQIGVDHGPVYTGSYGSSKRKTYGIHGSHVNSAAQLMMKAEVGRILAPRRIARMTREVVDAEEIGQVYIKGFEEPMHLVEIKEPALVKSNQKTAADSFFIIGRESELHRFERQLDDLLIHKSSIAIIEGEAGIGKTRLTESFAALVRGRGLRILHGSGSAIGQTTAYHAWRPVFRELFSVTETDSSDYVREQVMNLLEQNPEMAVRAPLLNPVLSLGLLENELTSKMVGEVRANNTGALLVWLLKAARNDEEPLVLSFEDAHWLDSASWGLVDRVGRELSDILILIVTRPMGTEANEASAHEVFDQLTALEGTEHYLLNVLSREEIRSLVGRRLGVKIIPADVSDYIYQRSEGHPFFSEELAYALRDAGIVEISGEELVLRSNGKLQDLEFPETIQGVITSRIDRLDPGEELALKVASVIGRVFLFRTLREIYPVEAALSQLEQFVNTLAKLDITPLEARIPELTYIFRHALTHEVAYSLLLFRQRRELHRAVALWYEHTHEDELEQYYPLLANHWSKGQDIGRTIYYLEAAGNQALKNFANREAVNFFTETLSVSRGQPYLASSDGRPVDTLRRAGWMRRLGEAYLGLGRLTESRSYLLKMLTLVHKKEPDTQTGLILEILRQVFIQAAHRLLPGLFLNRVKERREIVYIESAHSYQHLAEIYYYANERMLTLNAGLHVLNLAESASPSPELARAYANMVVIAGLIPWHGAAEAYSQRALRTAEVVGDQSASAWAHLLVGTYKIGLGAWGEVEFLAGEAIRLSQALGDFRVMGLGLGVLTLTQIGRGKFNKSLELYRQWLKIALEGNNLQHQAFGYFGQAENLLPLGEIAEAVELTERGLQLLLEIADRSFENRAAEIRGFGLLAIGKLRQGDFAGSWEAAGETLRVIDQLSAPTRVTFMEGLSGVTETYLRLWQRQLEGKINGPDLGASAKKAVGIFTQYARVFPIAKPRSFIWRGVYYTLSGDQDKAARTLKKGLADASSLGMPYDEALAMWEIGQLSTGLEEKRFLQEAQTLFTKLGVKIGV